MARHDVIDGYVRELAARLGAGSEDVLDEVRDHLLEAARGHAETGADPAAAARMAVSAFGDPGLVAEEFIQSGFPRSTRFTRAAGLAGLASAVLVTGAICLFVAGAVAERTRPWEGLPSLLESFGVLALVSGVALSMVAGAGLLRRVGSRGGWTLVPLGLMGVAAITSFVAWFPWVWATAFGFGVALLAVHLRRAGVAPRRALFRASGGALATAAVPWAWAALHGTEVGIVNVDPARIGLAAGLILWASGAAVLGWWLVWEKRRPAAGHASIAAFRTDAVGFR